MMVGKAQLQTGDAGCREQASERAVRLDLSVPVMQQDDSALAVARFVQRARATSLVTPLAIGLLNGRFRGFA